MKNVIIILFFTFNLVACDGYDEDHEGANCTTNTNEAGVCRYFYDCEYATNRVRNKKKIKDCFYKGFERYVCCVETATATIITNNKVIEPPEPLTDKLFVKLHREGLMQTGDIECRFNGTFPVICCRIVHDYTNLKFNEPPNCPELKKPYAYSNLSPHQSVIYEACYAYSRLGSKCVKDEIGYDEYFRDNCARFRQEVKISDGDPAKIKEFPHMAVIGGKNNQTDNIIWLGSGSLISEYFILTAAHAVGQADIGPVKYALLGTLFKNDTRSGEMYHIVKILRHPEHSWQTKKNDIALLKLHTRVIFSDFIRPACLTFPGSKEYEHKACTVAGWGDMGERQKTSDILLKATVYQEYDHALCPKSLHQRHFVWDSTTMICAKSGNDRPNQDTCKGDSGGPLMTMSNRYIPCSYFVAGIVSWGARCGVNLMGAYTNASYDQYQEWIVETVWPLQLKAHTINLT